MNIKFRRNENDDAEKSGKTNAGIGEKEIIEPVTFESEKDEREIIEPVTFGPEEDEREIIEPITFEPEKIKGQESCSEISARKGIQAKVSGAMDGPLHTPQEVTPAVSFFVKHVDLNNSSIEPATINDELGELLF